MNHGYQLRGDHRAPVLSHFWILSIILVIAVCWITCSMAWPVAAQQESLGMLRFDASGPVQIEVHDSEGNIVSRDVIEIEGASFHDEDAEIIIEIPDSVAADYMVYVNVNGSAIRLQHFDISATNGTDTLLLADNTLIVNAPHDPYVVRNSAEGIVDVTGEAGSAASAGLSIWKWIVAGAVVVLCVIILIIRQRRK